MRATRTNKLFAKLSLTMIMLILTVFMILPFLWMLSGSFKVSADVFEFPIRWIPKQFNFNNYVTVWKADYMVYFLNSVKITMICIVCDVFTCLLAGYAFAKIKFKGRNVAFILYVATIMFPGQMLLIPRFVLFRMLGMYDSHLALILPGAFSAFGTFLLRQYFLTLPNELSEAARIDGCNHLRIFFNIAVPLSMPAISTLVILSFVGMWNNYESALVYLNSKRLFTLPLGLLQFQMEEHLNYGALMAASTMSLLPIFVVFFCLQRYFIEGIAAAGIKG